MFEETPPGGDVAALAAMLAPLVEPGALARRPASEVLEIAAAFARLEAFAAAGLRAAAVALDRCAELADRCAPIPGRVQVTGLAADELAERLAVSGLRAGRLVAEGRLFDGQLGQVGEALLIGRIDAGKAGVFAQKLADQPLDVVLAVCEVVLPRAGVLGHRAVSEAIDEALIAVDPEGADRRHRAAAAARSVTVRRGSDGMGRLTLHAPMAQVALVDTACERIARAERAAGDPRTLAQLRADALTGLAATAGELTLVLPADDGPGRRRPSLAALFYADPGEAVGARPEPDPDELLPPLASLTGFGPLPPATAGELAASAPPWLRVERAPSGEEASPSPSPGYRPSAELERYVRARDGHCIAPGCTVPAGRCDVDHLLPHPAGATSAENLNALCRHHHLLKTHAGYRLFRSRGGTLGWTTPLGQRFLRDPVTRRWRWRPP